MRTITSIELGPDSCVLVRARPQKGGVAVSRTYGLQPDEAPPADAALSEHLREIRRRHRFPRHACVVLWGLPGSPLDAATAHAAAAPVRDAGFTIHRVLTPTEALAALAKTRQRQPGGRAVAWVCINRHGAAIAIVEAGRLLYERELTWAHRATATVREELLQRYSRVAHLAPELRHGFSVVREAHGVVVDTVVTCGDLPDLRSLTMPLIEELDMEVEILDTFEGLEVAQPLRAEDLGERSPAVRLACGAAAASVTAAAPGWVPAGKPRMMAAAAIFVAALLAWGAWRFLPVAPPVPPESARAAAPSAPSATPMATQPRGAVSTEARSGEPTATVTSPADAETARPAATTGRADVPPARVQPSEPSAAPGPVLQPPGPNAGPPPAAGRQRVPAVRQPRAEPRTRPLALPLPVVNSILVSPDRRLAVVDGEIVREGDPVGPRVLIRIERGAVVLREPSGREVTVPIRRRLGGTTG